MWVIDRVVCKRHHKNEGKTETCTVGWSGILTGCNVLSFSGLWCLLCRVVPCSAEPLSPNGAVYCSAVHNSAMPPPPHLDHGRVKYGSLEPLRPHPVGLDDHRSAHGQAVEEEGEVAKGRHG